MSFGERTLTVFLTEFPSKNVPSPSSFGNLKEIAVDVDNIAQLPWGTRATKIPEGRSVSLPIEQSNGNERLRAHTFINTGLGSITSLSLSTVFHNGSEEVALLAIAKASRSATVQGASTDTQGILQIWSCRGSSPTRFQLEETTQVTLIAQLVFVPCPPKGSFPPPIFIRNQTGTCQLFEIHQNAASQFSLARKLWQFQIENAIADCISVSTVDSNKDAIGTALAIGTPEGRVFIFLLAIQISNQSHSIKEISREQIFLDSTGISAICWMPNTYASFFAAGTRTGDLLICDRRNPLSPIIATSDHPARRIHDIQWDDPVNPIAVGQLDANLFAFQYMESSRHSPFKLYNDVRVSDQKNPDEDNTWLDLLLPSHRKGVIAKAIEQPCKAVGVVKGQGCFAFEDGSALVGNLKEMDRKSYTDSGLIAWNLIGNTLEENSNATTALVPSSSSRLEAAVAQLSLEFDKGYQLALQDGIHIMTASYYAFPGILKSFAARGARRDMTYSPHLEILALTSASAGMLPGTGPLSGVLAYGSALGVVHIFPSDYFD